MSAAPETLDQAEVGQKFLHNIATPLTSIRLVLKRTLEEVAGKRPPSPPEKQTEHLMRAIQAIDEIEKLHAEHKAYLVSLKKTP